jgi:predicted nuclease with TOPRIM domain
MTQKGLRASGEGQQPQIDEYSTNEKEDQSQLKRQRIQEDTSETEHLRLENDRLRGENDELKRQLQNLKGKYDERGELINRLWGRWEK